MLVMNQLDQNSDKFISRYPFVLAQLIYVAFCWAYPQSHPKAKRDHYFNFESLLKIFFKFKKISLKKFNATFRESIFQTCSIWMCGLKHQPNLAVSKWRLSDLEPVGFRATTAKLRISTNEAQHSGPVEVILNMF